MKLNLKTSKWYSLHRFAPSCLKFEKGKVRVEVQHISVQFLFSYIYLSQDGNRPKTARVHKSHVERATWPCCLWRGLQGLEEPYQVGILSFLSASAIIDKILDSKPHQC